MSIRDALPAKRFAELRRQGLSYAEIGERVNYSASRVAVWGRECLPDDLRTNRAGGEIGPNNRWRNGKRIEDVLPVAKFVEMREAGMSFREIGEEIGYSDTSVNQYGRRVLPEGLMTWRSAGTEVQRAPSYFELATKRCERCTMLESEGNPLEMVEVERDGEVVEEQWCALCRLEGGGIELLEFFESGMAAEVGIYV